ncbi:MAG: methyltransferase domain-containing protein [Gammaproteobacteria bacterium]|nr:methyltransferase domain-containing protein [Gammaproteobacteria bacterium]
MDIDTFYTDHWKQIEDVRVERYEQMFQWRDTHAALLAPADILPGHTVLDFGCGPGFMSLALADMVGESGHVHGADINARFVADSTKRAAGRANVEFHHLTGAGVPLPDAHVDRVLCKNVLEYVPNAAATLKELYRVVVPGGKIHATDSDWGFVLVEPWGKEGTERFFTAAAPAFKEPFIGRKLLGLLRGAGCDEVSVRMAAFADQGASGFPSVLTNMRSYIAAFDTMPADEADAMITEVERAIEAGTYLFCLPQFLVTGTKP